MNGKWVQGGTDPDAYATWHWYLIDVFVYFSHSLVTLPPPCWTNTAHKRGVKVLYIFLELPRSLVCVGGAGDRAS